MTQDEALKTVKTIENVLRAWNEYRVCVAATGKAGRKLAGALKDLSGHMDKTTVAGLFQFVRSQSHAELNEQHRQRDRRR